MTAAQQLAGAPPERAPLRVDLGAGRLETGGRHARFDPYAADALELAYLRLVRDLRDVRREPSFVLRSADVRALAEATRRDAAEVLDRLGELMGATVTQRRSMVTAFAAGALLIAVATGAAALSTGGDDRVLPAASPEQVETAGEVTPTFELADAIARGTATAEVEDDAGAGVDVDVAQVPSAGASAPSSSPPAPAAPAPSAGSAPDTGAPAPSPGDGTVQQPGAGPDLPADDVEVVQPGPIDLGDEGDDVEIVQPGADIDIPADDDVEIVQPGADIDIPADDEDDVEIVQPGADIDIPADDPVEGG